MVETKDRAENLCPIWYVDEATPFLVVAKATSPVLQDS